jgi:uncharacterized membrane protein
MFEVDAFRAFAGIVTTALEALGVVVLTVGVVIAFSRAAIDLVRRADDVFGLLRRRLGKGILLGLEVLIAGDIVRTVAIDPSIQSIAELALIVLVRTVLSIVLELEISGRWPWQAKPSKAPVAD